MCYLQSARSSARFHGEHEGQAGAAPPPWRESPCERPGSPRCWKIKPERETGPRESGFSIFANYHISEPAGHWQ